MVSVDVGWFVNGLREVRADVYVVIDVLRFSTTVATALAYGFKEVYVFSDLSKAVEFARVSGAPLAAEVEGIKPVSADLDNSPTGIIDYVSKYGVGNGKLVIRTTSGALIVNEAINLGLRNVFIGSLVNAKFVAEVLKELKPLSIGMICAGFRRSKFAIEDFLGAGAITYELTKVTDVSLGDEAIAALHTYLSLRDKILEVIKSGRGGSFLWHTGRDKDVIFASRVNAINIVPVLSNNVIRAFSSVGN